MIGKCPYKKPATTYAEQIALLKKRGMVIPDEAQAAYYVQHIGYYRLGAYWLPFEKDHSTHTFKPDTNFQTVLNLYHFDRALRLLVLDAIERIEVSVRAQWAYHMGHIYGAHAHLNPKLATRFSHWQNNVDALKKEVDRADEIFIQHFTNKYKEDLPPIWAVCEVMSLGLLSRWYAALKPMQIRSKIAKVYGVDESVMQSWLHHLSVVRNVCAHHSRLWDRSFSRVPPKVPHNKPASLRQEFVDADGLYNTLVLILHFLDVICPEHHWRQRFQSLIKDYPSVPLTEMAFPETWKQSLIWKGN